MLNLDDIRNIGIIAHIDAGKTTTSEGMLFFSGLTHRFGNIDQGTTVMDYLPEERARGITIVAAAATIPWGAHLIHMIDTPGHIDFTAEVERSLRVIDGAVVIFSGVEGVEAQSEKVWRQADRYKVPKIAFINKLDRVGAAFARVVAEINETFGNVAVPVQMPVGVEGDFTAIIDLVAWECIRFGGDDNERVERGPVPDDVAELAQSQRETLLERLADASDDIAMRYLEGDELPPTLVHETIRRLTIANQIVPVFVGAAKRRFGIQPLLDGVIQYLPSPADIMDIPAHRAKDDDLVTLHPEPEAAFAGLVFKVIADPSADLLFLRTYAGTLHANATLVNARTKEKVRAKQVLRLFAKNTQPLETVGPGDIVGVIGPRDCGTGDTLCDANRVVAFEKITFPDPVISVAVEPRFSRDKERLDEALDLLCREDPTLFRDRHEETGQRILSGMGELHLEINLKRLANDFHVEARAGEPRVAYRETLRAADVERAVFQKTFGETELYAEVEVAFEPLARSDETFAVRNALRNRALLPKDLVRAAEGALADGLRTGGNCGYPLIYLAAELRDLVAAQDRTTEGAVVGAVLKAIDQAIRRIGTVVLEPIMRLEILTPEQTVGEITTHLQPRRAIIHEMIDVGEVKRIACEVPLAEMFGFGKALPKLSGGRAAFTMEPCGYQEIPAEIAKRMFG